MEEFTVSQKALRINLNPQIYGTFSEIGAGQETVRYFFRVGGASNTVAKAMSAYDKTFSDAIYGKEDDGRYVTEQRLKKMLSHEWSLMNERLVGKEVENKCFFTFANTVATINFSKSVQGQGWFGVRFQSSPQAPFNEIILHIKFNELEAKQQQETAGMIGVNLIYAAYNHLDNIQKFLFSLYEDIDKDKFNIDVANFFGEDLKHIDNRLISLFLVKNKMTDAVCFGPDKNNISVADFLYKKNLLILRGSFRPVTKVNMDMAKQSYQLFLDKYDLAPQDVRLLFEITLNNLLTTNQIDEQDFLARVDLICSLGEYVLITSQSTFYDVLKLTLKYTNKHIGLIIGIPYLKEMFKLKYYTSLKGGILEAFGSLFMNHVSIYLYPMQDPTNGSIINSKNFSVYPRIAPLYDYLRNRITDIENFDKESIHIFSREVIEKIRQGDMEWVEMVPEGIAEIIQKNKLFLHH